MFKRILSVLFCTVFFLSFSLTAFADPVTNNSDSNSTSSDQDRIEDLEDSISRLDNEIVDYLEQLEQLKKQISESEEKVAQKENELKETQADIDESRDAFGKRMRYLYQSDYEKSFLYVLLDSEGIGDFISRITTLKYLIDHDKKIIEELKRKESELDFQRNLLLEENSKLQVNRQELDTKLARINNLKDSQTSLINSLKSKSTARSKFVAFEFPSRGGASSFGYDIIDYAKNFLGTPYVWGGNTPEKGFDCSGFTQYVFKNFGISLNRTSSSQALQGTPVLYSDLQPGDLVFYGSPVYHVGIYVGGNQFIHAPHRGDVVKVAPIIAKYYSTARRIKP